MEESKAIEWIFSGIGTTILSYVVTAFLGAFVGYKIGVRSTVKQNQKAGKNSEQYQSTAVKNSSSTNRSQNTSIELVQKQESGDNSFQRQIGDTHNDG